MYVSYYLLLTKCNRVSGMTMCRGPGGLPVLNPRYEMNGVVEKGGCSPFDRNLKTPGQNYHLERDSNVDPASCDDTGDTS
jgi:hypothetical protein